MTYDLASLWRRTSNPRRPSVDLRPIQPPQALASDLYAVSCAKVVSRVSAAVPELAAAYARHGARDASMMADAASDMQAPLNSLSDELRQIVAGLVPGIATWADRIQQWHQDRWKASVLAGTGVDLSTVLMASGRPKSVADSVAWNSSLVRNVSDEAQAKIGQTVFSAFQARRSATDLAKDLREIVAMTRRRSLNIASDQLTKLSGALDRERAVEAGLRRYTWRHSAKRHPRIVHVERNGQVFVYDDPPADGPPGSLPFCGCRAQAKLELD